MKTRIVAGILAAVLATLLVFYGPPWLLTLVAMIFAIMAYLEYTRLFFPSRSIYPQIRMIPFLLFAMLCIETSLSLSWIFLWLPFVLLGIPAARRANVDGEFQRAVREVAVDLLGFIYTLSLLAFLKPIAMFSHGREFLFLFFMVVFGGDTFAYFGGVTMGRHRLATQLSPKKSVEGAVAAVLGSLGMAALWTFLIYSGEKTPAFLWRLFLFIPFLSVLAQMGDLFESLLKRSQAQKDSGHFLPGHGGILDRIDSFAFAAPVFYLYLILVLHKV